MVGKCVSSSNVFLVAKCVSCRENVFLVAENVFLVDNYSRSSEEKELVSIMISSAYHAGCPKERHLHTDDIMDAPKNAIYIQTIS
jgi:hypothetical protein